MSKSEEITLTGNPFGFRISKVDRDRLSKKLKTRIKRDGFIIEFPSGESPRLPLKVTSSFWEDLPQFTQAKITAWMEKRGDTPWPKGKPPKYDAKFSKTGAREIRIKILRKQNEDEQVNAAA